uniref:Uncharacterized protein AlNc14C65G4618 n=1 Tax=Albugo laibachii Nc14 TaxID=890382 RepID=F0WD98_9STRA|nr:conserved hypothetical protein [Albugo laibachii Nc14]|eukprot:CCA19170.1 conserved hypothetical protein [Albugo laibachii Nc14]
MTFHSVRTPTFSLHEYTRTTRRVSCSSIRERSYCESFTSDLEENALSDDDKTRASMEVSKRSFLTQSPNRESRQQLCNPFHRLTLRSTKTNHILPVADETSNLSSRTSSSSSLQLSDEENDAVELKHVVVVDLNESAVSDGDDIALLEDETKPSFSSTKPRERKTFLAKLRESIIDDSSGRQKAYSMGCGEDEFRPSHFFVPDSDTMMDLPDSRGRQQRSSLLKLAEEHSAGACEEFQHWDFVESEDTATEKDGKHYSRHSAPYNGPNSRSFSELEAARRLYTTASISRISERRRRPHTLVANQCIYLTFKTRFRDVYGQVSSHKNRLSQRVTCFPLNAEDLHHPEQLESDTQNLFHINAHTIDGQLRGGDCVVLARSDGSVLRKQSITKKLVFSRREDSKSKFIISGIRDGMLVGNTMPFYLVSVCDRSKTIGFLHSSSRFEKNTFGWLVMCPTQMRREEASVVEPIYFLQRILE